MHRIFCQSLVILVLGCATANVLAQENTDSSKDVAMIEAAIQSYVAAFNERNAEKLVAHWSPEGVYTSRSNGEKVNGRDSILQEFKTIFSGETPPKLAVQTDSIEFISPNVALERGSATVTMGESETSQTEYRVVYVKKDGAWLIDRVTEEPLAETSTRYEQLKQLEWLIGDWVYEGEEFSLEMSCQWTTNQNFISRKFKVIEQGEVQSSGLQIIGWDEKEKGIRSWLFDSDGGTVNGKWTNRDDRWIIQSTATLADGGSGSYTTKIQPLEDGNFQWGKINRVLDGKILPNIDSITIQRK